MKIFKNIIVISMLIVLVFSLSVFAQQEKDPFDLSQYEEDIKELGIPTKEKVSNLKNDAITTFKNENYKEAENKLADWAKASNYLANIIAKGLEPFYSASYDNRDSFSYDKIKKISSYESLSNQLKSDRNHAMVMRAEALVELDKTNEAMAVYQNALDLIDIEDWEWWIRASNGLYKLVGVETIDND